MLMDFGSLEEFNHGLAPLLYNAVSSQEWQEMVRRMPELATPGG